MGTHPIFESDFDCLTEQKMEIVESEIEKILPAYRAAIHCELLSEAEGKQLLVQRRQGESRLIKREVAREDYVNYVARDSMLLKLIQKRRKKTNYTHKLGEIEYVFVGKLNRVMKRAHRLWPDDERIWATHIALLSKWNKRTQLSKLYEEYTARYPHNVNIWLEAVRFQIERNGSADQARKLLYRAQQNNEAEPLIYDQLFRVELINAAILRKRLEITGTVALESESANIELVDGSAAIKVAELAMKTFPTNGHLVAAMLRCVLNCATPFDTVKAFLIDAPLGMDSVSALDARAQYYVAHVTNGLDLAKNVYQSELEKERDDGAEVLAQYIGFLAQHKSTRDLNGAIERLESLLALETNIAACFHGGNMVNILVEYGHAALAYRLQERIVAENERDENEQIRLAVMMVKYEKSGAKDKLFELIKTGNNRIKAAAEELATQWAAADESRLSWFSSISAQGRIAHVTAIESARRKCEKVLQFSSSQPIDTAFVSFGLETLQTEHERLAFIDKCCRTAPCASSYVDLLKMTQRVDLANLNAVMTRARGALNGVQYERMHQLWQNKRNE